MAHERTRAQRGERGIALQPSREPGQRQPHTEEARHRIGASRLGIPLAVYQFHRFRGERWCSNCKRWQQAELFVRNKHTPDGYGNICRESAKAITATRYRHRAKEGMA